jgi:hypothetical protein
MKGWILLVITLFLLQAAALAAALSFFDGDFEGVPDDDDDLATLYLFLNLLVYGGVMLTTQLLPQQRDPSVFDQRLMWADYVKQHTERKRNNTFNPRLRMELKAFNKLLGTITIRKSKIHQGWGKFVGGFLELALPSLVVVASAGSTICSSSSHIASLLGPTLFSIGSHIQNECVVKVFLVLGIELNGLFVAGIQICGVVILLV